MLTQERLKELLNYDKDTGIFTWLVSRGSVKKGFVAGCDKGDGYLIARIDRKGYRCHRLAWLYIHGSFPFDEIDHVNGIRSDNRFVNLRSVLGSENKKNKAKPKNNTSGIVGVNWSNYYSDWTSRISINGKDTTLGRFKDKFEAICSRKSAENKYQYHENHGRSI